MFGLFNKKDNILPYIDDEGNMYDADDVTVYYEGTLISPEYAAETLVWQNNGKKLRDDFNTQPYPHHMLLPHGKGKMTYKDGDEIIEQYEGEFQYGQYHGQGTLIYRYGEVLEGTFKENKYIKNK
jgi:hypothetical protein